MIAVLRGHRFHVIEFATEVASHRGGQTPNRFEVHPKGATPSGGVAAAASRIAAANGPPVM